jgi:response regulator RpfG family c-di-GMP phosphodiesterase
VYRRSDKKIISVVDDDPDIVCLFFNALNENIDGVKTFKFTDPILALEHFKYNKNHYCLIICDNRMPGMSGIELSRSVKSMNPLVRTILLTAFDIDDNLFKANQGSIDSLLQKPVRIPKFTEEVKKQIGKSLIKKQKIPIPSYSLH